MTVVSQRSARLDLARSGLLTGLATVQLVVAARVWRGGLDAHVVVTAREYRTPLVPTPWAFAGFLVVAVGFLGYAIYQLLPGQRGREIHRRTGWCSVTAALAGTGWLLAFGGGWLLTAELLLIVLMSALALLFGRLSREPAAGPAERAAFRSPIALYAGWTSVLVPLGTAATGVYVGLPGDSALSAVAAIVVLLAVAVIISLAVLSGSAVVCYAGAAVWLLVGIALNDPPSPVVLT